MREYEAHWTLSLLFKVWFLLRWLWVPILIMGLVALIIFAAPALAQQMPCSTREDVANGLKQKYQEEPEYAAVTNSGTLMEIFTAENTWTVVVSKADGTFSCLIAAGEGQLLRKEKKGDAL